MAPKSPDNPRNKTIGDIFADIRRPDPGADTAWYKVGPTQGINFTNSWDNVAGATIPDTSWYLADDGEVRMRGRITGGIIGTVVTVLPEEIRPEFTAYFPVDSEIEGHFSLESIRYRAFQTAPEVEDDG